jgi:tRNA threonylcarbamoyladenosine biosynthesis protein TsaE
MTAAAVLSGSEQETERLGEVLAPALEAGDLIALEGPLGAGKTRFVTGLARGLGCAERVRSPSFTLVNEYRGRIPLVHLDLYRLEERDAEGLGLDEYLERGAVVVEWGERLPSARLVGALRIVFTLVSPVERRLSAAAVSGGRGRELLLAWSRMAAP